MLLTDSRTPTTIDLLYAMAEQAQLGRGGGRKLQMTDHSKNATADITPLMFFSEFPDVEQYENGIEGQTIQT